MAQPGQNRFAKMTLDKLFKKYFRANRLDRKNPGDEDGAEGPEEEFIKTKSLIRKYETFPVHEKQRPAQMGGFSLFYSAVLACPGSGNPGKFPLHGAGPDNTHLTESA